MRTILIGRKHGAAAFELIAGPEVSPTEQIIKRDNLNKSHPVNSVWSEVEFWREEPAKNRLRFSSPEEAKAKAESDAKADADFADAQKKRAAEIAKSEADKKVAEQKKHAEAVSALDKRTAAAVFVPKTK
jgi:hypothetical protein